MINSCSSDRHRYKALALLQKALLANIIDEAGQGGREMPPYSFQGSTTVIGLCSVDNYHVDDDVDGDALTEWGLCAKDFLL